MNIRSFFALVLLFLAVISRAQAPSPVTWTGELSSTTAKPGEVVQVILKAKIAAPWHLYSQTKVEEGPFPTTIKVKESPAIAEVGKPTQQKPITKLDQNFGKNVEYYEGETEFRIPVRAAKSLGEGKISVDVRYQVCNESTCIPPTTKTVDVKLAVAGEAVATPAPLDATPETSTAKTPEAGSSATPRSDVDKARSEGLLSFLGLSILSGFLALLTPCVFPMIPITVSFFSKRKSTDGLKEGVRQAGLYCVGIVGTFTALGVVVAALFGATGVQSLANNPYMNMVLALVFIGLALSLFGFFEIGLPPALLNKVQGSGTGFLAPILMGLTFSLTSFTCTLPFVGAVLLSASKGDYLYPVLGMVGFSGAFCIPFFFLALFPQALSALPKSGAWLATTKAYMGFIELAAAVKFISSVDLGIVPGGLAIITRPVYLSLWFAIFAAAGLYMVGLIRLPHVDEGPKIGWARRMIGALTLAGSLWIMMAINGNSLGELEAFLPPSPYPGRGGAVAEADQLPWMSNYDKAVAEAKATNKPLMIDFTGIYCTNCRYMEKNVFPAPEVKSKLEKYVRVKLYTDRDTDEDRANQKLLAKLTNSVTLPGYATVAVDGTIGINAFTRDRAKFSAFLEAGLSTKVASSK